MKKRFLAFAARYPSLFVCGLLLFLIAVFFFLVPRLSDKVWITMPSLGIGVLLVGMLLMVLLEGLQRWTRTRP